MSSIRENLKKYRKAKKLTQAQLAEMVGVHVYAIKSWEGGRYEPTARNAYELSKALDITMDQLLGHEVVEEKEEEPQADLILQHPSGRTAFIEEIMTMPEERFRHILKYSEFLKREASAEGTTDAPGK